MTPVIEETQQAHQAVVDALAVAKELQRRLMATQTTLTHQQRESSETASATLATLIDSLIMGKEPNVDGFARMTITRQVVDLALLEVGKRIREGEAVTVDRAADERMTFADLQRALADEEEARAMSALGSIQDDLGEGVALEFHDSGFRRRRDQAAEADLESVRLRERAQRTRAEHRAAEE